MIHTVNNAMKYLTEEADENVLRNQSSYGVSEVQHLCILIHKNAMEVALKYLTLVYFLSLALMKSANQTT